MSLFRTVASLTLAGLALNTQAVDTPERQHNDMRAFEISLKTTPSGSPQPNLGNAVMYSSTLVGTPTWTRPFADCTGATGLGPMGYQVQPFTVATTGAYDVTSVQDGGWDGYVFVYQTAFDPLLPNTNCVIGDDDGGGGIGTSDIIGVNLTAGTQYFVVTTAFENGEEGTFTNTINGPGVITLGGVGPQADLGVTVAAPAGVVTNGTFTYTLTATNNGPDPATGVVVTDLLSPSVTFVSSDCGATEAAGTVTWNIGAMANGGSATCTLTVSMGAVCAVVDNVASIDGIEGDPGAANNSSAISNSAGNLVLDPGFESGTPNANWTEASTNFGTPICDAGTCGVGGGTGPRSGTFWAWFGGYGGGLEAASVAQAMVIPAGSATLDFWVEFPVCTAANGANDYVRVLVDGNELWRENASSARCGVIGYQLVSVDISAYDDGLSHTVTFDSTTVGGTPTNFFVDDVSIAAAPVCAAGAVPRTPVPTLDRSALAALVILLGLFGIVATRQKLA
ncbi:MAG: DUF11 domain-containing protein [Xanthomonadales bacterium]|nr:DUF11 domain-containing protein [Xanthomonadales bacterium]